MTDFKSAGRNLVGKFNFYPWSRTIAGGAKPSTIGSSYIVKVEPNKTYTASRKTTELNNRFRFYMYNTDSDNPEDIEGMIDSDETSGYTEDSSLVFTFTTDSDTKWLYIYLSNQLDEREGIKDNNPEIKLEKGDRATDWIPAPEDVYNSDFYKTSVTYAHTKLRIDDYWNRGITGQGVKIGIVDDGIGTHEALPVSGGYACGKHTNYLQENEHATHCAGIAAGRNLVNGKPTGIAPEAEIYSIRMYYKTFEDRINSLIEAIDFAIEEKIDILSMSIHIAENSVNMSDGRGSSLGAPKHMRLRMRDAFFEAYKNGIIIVVAAGNHNDGSGGDNIEFEELLPKMPNVVTVANLSVNNKRHYTSGVGNWVDVAGYGYRINSTIPGNKYGHLTGTSMATPQVAGIFALYKQIFHDSSAQEIIEELFGNCAPVEGLKDTQQGRGVPVPPKELYELPALSTSKDSLRVRDYMSWVSIEKSYYSDGSEWKEMEAMGNG